MKRLLLTTSILALTATGAFAQGMNNAQKPDVGQSGMSSPSSSGSSGSSSMNSSDSTMGGQAATSKSTSNKQASADEVKQAQQALKQKGIYTGQVDGKDGPQTRSAISQFQKQNGLRQTAQLDAQTMAQLQSGDSSASPSPSRTPSAHSPSSMSNPGAAQGSDRDDDGDSK